MWTPRSQDAQRPPTGGSAHDAEIACRAAVQADPRDAHAAIRLARVLRLTGRATESVRLLQPLLQSNPRDAALAGELGLSLVAADQPEPAAPLLERAAGAMPAAVEWRLGLAECRLKASDIASGLRILREAQAQAPEHQGVLLHLARAHLLAGEYARAEPLLRRLLDLDPRSVPGRVLLAEVEEFRGRLGEAVGLLRGVLTDAPDHEPAIAATARCLRLEGRYADAAALLEPLASRELTPQRAIALAPIYLRQKRFEECRAMTERAMARESLPGPDRTALLFGLARALEGLGEYDEAFRAYKRANDLQPKAFRRDQRLRVYKEIRESCSAEIIRDGPRAGVDASRCVFIVGMPRSGTSLVEQILDAHPRAHGAGELMHLRLALGAIAEKTGEPPPGCLTRATAEALDLGARRYLGEVTALAPGADIITDKLPHNFELLGLINRMLPGARVIHCRRNPIDTCLSCYVTQLSGAHSYSNDLANLSWAYGQYRKLMEHWRGACDLPVLEVDYEAVVGDLEEQARRVVAFVGLEWDDRCLRFYESGRAVSTASVDQVRRPIYKGSVDRWRRYERHLGPLIESLRAAGVDLPDA